ncbi:abequosyltransferase [Azospirillaceae bacterium]
MFLSFIIPTYNRAAYIERCLLSIAQQIQQFSLPMSIIISDNASTDNTPQIIGELQKQFPFIRYHRRSQNGGYAANFHTLCQIVDGEYAWLFGDDDILLDGGLAMVLSVLKNEKPDFCHASVEHRLSGHGYVLRGPVISLCNEIGWLDFSGLMTSCVFKADSLRAAAVAPSWPLFAQNAFPHSCVLLEQCAYNHAVMIDRPIVATCEIEQTPECLKRWAAENVGWKYFLTADALLHMIKENKVPGRLPAKFFRYHNYFLWNRFISNLLHESYVGDRIINPVAWDKILTIVGMLSDRALAVDIRNHVEEARTLMDGLFHARKSCRSVESLVLQTCQTHGRPVFDFQLIHPQTLPTSASA